MKHLLTIFLVLVGAGLLVGGVLMTKSYPHTFGWLIATGLLVGAVGLLRSFDSD